MMDLIGRQDNLGFQRYGDRLKKSRKLLHDTLSNRHVNHWSGMVEDECNAFLQGLLNPKGIEEQILRCVSCNIEVPVTNLSEFA